MTLRNKKRLIASSLLVPASGLITAWAEPLAADAQSNSLEQSIMNGSASPSGGAIPPATPPANVSGSAATTKTAPSAPAAPSNPSAGATTATSSSSSSSTSSAASGSSSSPATPSVPGQPVENKKSAAELKIEENLKKAEESKRPVEEPKRATEESKRAAEESLKREKPAAAQSQQGTASKSVTSSGSTAGGGAKSAMLFGRIEQLSATTGASFPQLKALVPKLDTSQQPLKATVKQTALASQVMTGRAVSSFPSTFRGNWGGNLTLQVANFDPNYARFDPNEYKRTVQIMRPGMQGAINFVFNGSGKNISLSPARCMFLVPASETMTGESMSKMMGQNSGAMSGMMSQMMSGMRVPIVLEFGNIAQGGELHGVSGNILQQTVVKNETRQLSANIIEQDVVTQQSSRDSTGHVRNGYGENVFRFTAQGGGRMYVQVATVNYSSDKKYLSKEMLAGYIQQGAVAATPESYMQSQQSQLGGLGSFGGLPGGGQLPTGMPNANDPAGLNNMLKQLFGGQ